LFKVTNNKDYLDLALRIYNKEIMNSLLEEKDELEGKPANTQIPKVIGAATLYELLGDNKLRQACEFFWNIVTKNRSYVIGGNSRDEHFGKSGTEKLGVTTAETCNTYNMLKLTEHLYSWNHDSKYMDYYENALYNHILASQDPKTGMKTYFVSTQPGHFKVYCSPENSFWCCTGTGMENPARYIRNIYYRDEDNLFVNLFINSKIEIKDKKIIIDQKTDFPRSNKVVIKFEDAYGQPMNINIRIPWWVKGDVMVNVNGIEEFKKSDRGYLSINKNWNNGDVIEVTLPMDIEVYYSKEDKNKVAFMYGPVVLAGALGTENFPESDILEDHLKLNHYPGIVVPTLVSNDKNLKNLIKSVDLQRLEFETESIGQPGNVKCRLIPFYEIHHERYTIYWKT
ncbi:MAG: beta-L-arabinofuranosidase domain-containing protein, partial [Clostridium butyricum]